MWWQVWGSDPKKVKKKNQVVAGMGEKVKRNTSSRVVNIPQ
jgi:hypothetical protein